MSIKKYHSFGIFLEINKEKTCFLTQHECVEDKNHFSSFIEGEANYCPICGEVVISVRREKEKRYLNKWEIEKEAGLEDEALFGTMENPEELRKYFTINKSLDDVFNIDVSDDIPCLHSMRLNKTPKEYIDEAYKNPEFKSIIEKLENTYGDHFKIHFGIFTYFI